MFERSTLRSAVFCGVLSAVASQVPPSYPVLRLPVEGGVSVTICSAGGTKSTTGDAPVLRAQRRQAGPPWGTTVDTPKTHWYQGGDGKPQVTELPTPTLLNSSCMRVAGGTTTVDGPASLFTSRDNGTTWDNGTRVQYYETVSVAFGYRPFIYEANGTLLLEADSSLIAELQHVGVADQDQIVSVTLHLPFATDSRNREVTWKGNELFEKRQTVLRFALDNLPTTINQDVEISIVLSGGRRLSKLRRLMRAAPPPRDSFVQPVQVDHFTRSLRVDGRPFQGVGWYLDGLSINSLYPNGAPGFAGYSNLTQYVIHRQAPEGINQGMIYRLFTYPAEHQLAVLDQLNAVGFKVMYEVGHQLNRCGAGSRAPCDSDATDGEHDGETDCHVCFNESKTKLHWLEERINIVKDHPALLGYYICDDCCHTIDIGVSHQAQAFNFIRSIDPYHMITGAANCMPSYTWSDIPSSEPVTADRKKAVIGYGEQPATQLSLDYVMHEDYGGNLAVKAGDGTWSEGQGGDGAYRNGARWEPIANCPGVAAQWNTVGMTGQDTMLYSQSWLGAIDAGALDILIFIENGNLETESVVARYARQVAELGPSFRGRFGEITAPLTVNATALDPSTATSPMKSTSVVGGMPGYRLRAAVWEEKPQPPAVLCAHVVVVNLDENNPLLFQYTLGGRPPPPHASGPITSERIFSMGSKIKRNATAEGTDQWAGVQEWLGPSETGIYRVGCEAAMPPKKTLTPENLATVSLEAPAMQKAPGWELPNYGGIDPLVSLVSDAAIAVDGRHSTKMLVPNSNAVVIPLSGTQLVPPKSGYGWGEKTTVPAGFPLVSSSITLLPGKQYVVSMALQATPRGTIIELMGGKWLVPAPVTFVAKAQEKEALSVSNQ